MSDYTDLKAYLKRYADGVDPATVLEAIAAIDALQADIARLQTAHVQMQRAHDDMAAENARLRAVGLTAVDEWASWVHDQLDGTGSLAEAIAEVDATRAALTAPKGE